MRTRERMILGMLASILFAQAGWAQIPGAPVPPPVPGVATAVPTTPATPNLWSYLLPNADQKAACKACFCNSAIGQMVSGMAAPMSMMSGGMMRNCCALNAIEQDLKKDATSSEGAAARIKKDEADAKARRAAVRYLGTVDCNYWPEAIEALSLSLRKDPNECVRFEAALALRNGCCCQEKTVKALEICVEGSDKDGAPRERSDRVRAAAADALARCPMLQKEIENGKDGDLKKVQATDAKKYYGKLTPADRDQIVSSARGLLVSLNNTNNNMPAANNAVATNNQNRTIPPRSGSLSGIFSNAISTNGEPPINRQPFFTGLTNTLKGKQEDMMAVRHESNVPTPIPAPLPTPLPQSVVRLREPMPTGNIETTGNGETVRFRPNDVKKPADKTPTSAPEPLPFPPADIKPAVPMEITPPTPTLGVPQASKTEPTMDIIQTRPSPTQPRGPRATRGVVTVETANTPAIPEVVLPSAPRQ